MKFDILSAHRNDCANQKNEISYSDFDPDKRLESFAYFNKKLDIDPGEDGLQIEDFRLPFEQSVWYSLNGLEMDNTIHDFKEAIAKDLNLSDVPGLGYYFEENIADFGSYSSRDNKIYINCLQLDYPENIVKTIAHEMRHCWQIERINSPKEFHTEFEKILKFNNENYIQPYDNYCAYWNQPMEVDARLYSDHVLSTVFGNYKDEGRSNERF